MQYQKKVHKVYSLYYHVIFVLKYRQKVFLEGHDIVSDAKERMVELSGGHDVEIVEAECG
ncbi:MAG: transposase, partial [Promethearchaeota archaeon]